MGNPAADPLVVFANREPYIHMHSADGVEVLRPDAFCSVAAVGGGHLLDEFIAQVRFGGALLGFGPGLPDGVLDPLAIAEQQAYPDAAPRPTADSLFSICWTSGTEGTVKGVPKTHNNWLSSASAIAALAAVAPGDPILHAAPMSHGSGLYIMAHFMQRGVNVVPESAGFEAEEIFALLRAWPRGRNAGSLITTSV